MNNEAKRYVTYEEAVSLLPDGEYIHTFTNPAMDLMVGADWSREEILDKLRRSTIERTGPGARSLGHGIAAYTVDGGKIKGLLFIETDAEKLAKFEVEAQDGKTE